MSLIVESENFFEFLKLQCKNKNQLCNVYFLRCISSNDNKSQQTEEAQKMKEKLALKRVKTNISFKQHLQHESIRTL